MLHKQKLSPQTNNQLTIASTVGQRLQDWHPKMVQALPNILRQEQGAAMVYFALVLTMLLMFAGFALDGSNTMVQRHRMQNAADATALAGARLLAHNANTAAVNTEINLLAAENGADSAIWNLTQDGTAVLVTTTHSYDTFFASIMGYDVLTVTAAAEVGYEPATRLEKILAMGIDGCDCVNFDAEVELTAAAEYVPPSDGPFGPGGGACPANIDFETDALGNPLATGQILDSEWALNGVHITTHNPGRHPAMVFNSAAPTGGDSDLGAPNGNFGGPGHGNGGRAGFPGANSQSHGNILIISEDGNSSDPDDNGGGGTIIFTFDFPVRIDQVSILDVDNDEAGGTITAYRDAAGVIEVVSVEVLGLGDNSFQVLPVRADGVQRLEIDLPSSGGIPFITFCETVAPAVYDLGDRIWRDANSNGVQDVGERGIAGVDLELYATGLPQVVERVTTDATGHYRFRHLPAGSYTVKVANSNFASGGRLQGWYASPANAIANDAIDSDFAIGPKTAVASVPLGGGDNLTVDGGYVPPAGNVDCGFAWLDWDGALTSSMELVTYLNDVSSSGFWRVGDWVPAGPNVENVSAVRNALDAWVDEEALIVLYDDSDTTQGYHICGFAQFTISEYDLDGLPAWIRGQFDPTVVRIIEVDDTTPDTGVRSIQMYR